jgi:hypothetical protein
VYPGSAINLGPRATTWMLRTAMLTSMCEVSNSPQFPQVVILALTVARTLMLPVLTSGSSSLTNVVPALGSVQFVASRLSQRLQVGGDAVPQWPEAAQITAAA